MADSRVHWEPHPPTMESAHLSLAIVKTSKKQSALTNRADSQYQPLLNTGGQTSTRRSTHSSSLSERHGISNNERLLLALDSAVGGSRVDPSHVNARRAKSHKTKRKSKQSKEIGHVIQKENPNEHTTKDMVNSPLSKFRKASIQIKNQIIWKKDLERAEKYLKSVVQATSQTDTLTFHVNAFKRESQLYGRLSSLAKAILTLPSFNRTEKELEYVHQFTVRLKYFDRYSIFVRKELARFLYYETFQKGRVVLRQGHVGNTFYFILSGSVLVQMEEESKSDRAHNMIITELCAGAVFGELPNVRRKATVVCREDCEFLKIDRPDFEEILKKNYAREWNIRMKYLQEHPLFASWSMESLQSAAEGSTIVEHPPDTLLLKDLSIACKNLHVYFVIKGTCNIIEKVHLLESRGNGNQVQLATKDSKDKLTIAPITGKAQSRESDKNYQSGLRPTNFGVTRCVKRWWIISTLQPGDYFGVGEGREGMSVVSSHQNVELLRVNKTVFKKHSRRGMLASMHSLAAQKYPSQQEALQSYITSRRWEKYKRRLVIEAVQKKKTKTVYCLQR